MTRQIPPHGTYARAQRERKSEGSVCERCLRAQAIYLANWRRDQRRFRGPTEARVQMLGAGRCVGGLGWPPYERRQVEPDNWET